MCTHVRLSRAVWDRETGEVVERRLTPDHHDILSWVNGLPGPVSVTYEAGPTGFCLARALTVAGIECQVAAPSKLIRPAGDRVKTDARDAAHLARLLHLGQITAVAVPTADQEAARDLVRAREDCRGDLMAADSEFTPVVRRPGCIRGIATLTAFGLATEIGDWHRMTGRTIGAYLGLVPSEFSSGGSRVQGEVTKTGNKHVRRLLVEAAWHHRSPYRPGQVLRRRWDLASPAARTRGQAANRRLHYRWTAFDQRRKRSVVANIAVARELAGWCWSLAVLDE